MSLHDILRKILCCLDRIQQEKTRHRDEMKEVEQLRHKEVYIIILFQMLQFEKKKPDIKP